MSGRAAKFNLTSSLIKRASLINNISPAPVLQYGRERAPPLEVSGATPPPPLLILTIITFIH